MTMELNHKIITLLNTGSMGLIQLSAELGDDGLSDALDELIAEGSIIRSRGEYRVSKERMILDVLDDNGACSYEFLRETLKESGRLSRGALHLIDVEIYSLMNRNMILVDSRCAYRSKMWMDN